ncbi:ORF17 [Haliotid herpesvirus 1]|uniref:Uncharacterized protein n=1 Tax=Abalone herpesvirus Taiwan/2005 TaxID=1821058 RepID=A0A145VUU3_9VIRU|nr:hypothetical protein tc2005_p070c [Abalone herpesvirus Taiwan/2005]UCX57007.1 ORF17 [Haliotid herpesvirus 1]
MDKLKVCTLCLLAVLARSQVPTSTSFTLNSFNFVQGVMKITLLAPHSVGEICLENKVYSYKVSAVTNTNVKEKYEELIDLVPFATLEGHSYFGDLSNLYVRLRLIFKAPDDDGFKLWFFQSVLSSSWRLILTNDVAHLHYPAEESGFPQIMIPDLYTATPSVSVKLVRHFKKLLIGCGIDGADLHGRVPQSAKNINETTIIPFRFLRNGMPLYDGDLYARYTPVSPFPKICSNDLVGEVQETTKYEVKELENNQFCYGSDEICTGEKAITVFGKQHIFSCADSSCRRRMINNTAPLSWMSTQMHDGMSTGPYVIENNVLFTNFDFSSFVSLPVFKNEIGKFIINFMKGVIDYDRFMYTFSRNEIDAGDDDEVTALGFFDEEEKKVGWSTENFDDVMTAKNQELKRTGKNYERFLCVYKGKKKNFFPLNSPRFDNMAVFYSKTPQNSPSKKLFILPQLVNHLTINKRVARNYMSPDHFVQVWNGNGTSYSFQYMGDILISATAFLLLQKKDTLYKIYSWEDVELTKVLSSFTSTCSCQQLPNFCKSKDNSRVPSDVLATFVVPHEDLDEEFSCEVMGVKSPRHTLRSMLDYKSSCDYIPKIQKMSDRSYYLFCEQTCGDPTTIGAIDKNDQAWLTDDKGGFKINPFYLQKNFKNVVCLSTESKSPLAQIGVSELLETLGRETLIEIYFTNESSRCVLTRLSEFPFHASEEKHTITGRIVEFFRDHFFWNFETFWINAYNDIRTDNNKFRKYIEGYNTPQGSNRVDCGFMRDGEVIKSDFSLVDRENGRVVPFTTARIMGCASLYEGYRGVKPRPSIRIIPLYDNKTNIKYSSLPNKTLRYDPAKVMGTVYNYYERDDPILTEFAREHNAEGVLFQCDDSEFKHVTMFVHPQPLEEDTVMKTSFERAKTWTMLAKEHEPDKTSFNETVIVVQQTELNIPVFPIPVLNLLQGPKIILILSTSITGGLIFIAVLVVLLYKIISRRAS